MNIHFTVNLTEELIKVATRRLTLRSLGLPALIGPALMITAGLAGILQQRYNVALYSMTAALAVYGLVLWIGFTVRRRQALARFRQIQVPTVEYLLTDERIEATTALGTTHILWSSISAIWTFPEVWFLFFNRDSYATLPGNQVPEEAKVFIREKGKSVKAKIQ